jgi:hypothetical protein
MLAPLLACLVLQDSPDLVSHGFHVVEGLQVHAVELQLPPNVLAVPGPTSGLHLLPRGEAGPVLFVRTEGQGHTRTTLAESVLGVQSAAATFKDLWVLRDGNLVQIRRNDPNGWKSEARIEAAPADCEQLTLDHGQGPLTISNGDLQVRWGSGSWFTFSGGLERDTLITVMEDGTRVVIDALPNGDRLATLAPGAFQPIPVIDGDLSVPDVDPDLARIGDLIRTAPVAWPMQWQMDVLIARPALGRIEGVQLLQRRADFALGGVRTVLQADPEHFAPHQLIVDANGRDLWVLGRRADGSTRLLRISAETPRTFEEPAASLDTVDPSLRFQVLDDLVTAKLEGLAELDRQLLGAGVVLDRSVPRALQVPVYVGQLQTVGGRVAAVHGLAAFLHAGAQHRLRAKILLERCLFHQAPEVRVAACEILSYWPDELTNPDRFAALLGDPDGRVAAAAAHTVASRNYRLLGSQLYAFHRLVLESGGPASESLLASQASSLIRMRAWRPIVDDLCRESILETRVQLWSLLQGNYDSELLNLLRRRLHDTGTPFQIRLEIVDALVALHRRPNGQGALGPWEETVRIEGWLADSARADESPAVRERASQALAELQGMSPSSNDE